VRCLLALCLVAIAVVPAPSNAEVSGSEFESALWRVRLSAPRSWQMSERSSYPNILLWMSRRSPRGKMLFSAERLPTAEGAREFAARTVTTLGSLGFQVRAPQLHSSTGAYWIDIDKGGAYLRQAFLVSGRVGYTVTLSAETRRSRSQHLRAFDATLRSIRTLQSAPPTTTPAEAAGKAAKAVGEATAPAADGTSPAAEPEPEATPAEKPPGPAR
jgi:hypothetical protein